MDRESLQVFVQPYSCSICAPLVTRQMSILQSSSCDTRCNIWRSIAANASTILCRSCGKSFYAKTFAQNALNTWLRHLQFPARASCWLLGAPDKRFSHTLDRLGRWPRTAYSFRSAQAATMLEFHVPLTNCFVHRRFCVAHGPKPMHRHNWLSFGEFQDTEHFLIPCPHHVSSRLPPSDETCKYATARSTQKRTWRDSLLLICSFLLCLSWLLHSRVRKFRRELWITVCFMYFFSFILIFFFTLFGISVNQFVVSSLLSSNIIWHSSSKPAISLWYFFFSYYFSSCFICSFLILSHTHTHTHTHTHIYIYIYIYIWRILYICYYLLDEFFFYFLFSLPISSYFLSLLTYLNFHSNFGCH